MTNKNYEILKWVVIVVFPAVLTFFGVVGATLNLECTETVLTIGNAFNIMLGTILGVSNVRYNKRQDTSLPK